MSTKKTVITLSIISILMLLIFFTLFIYMYKEKRKVYEISNISKLDRLYLPVEIDNKKYKFLFDTGASSSSIDEELVKEHKIELSDIIDSAAILSPTFKIIEIKNTKNVKFKISDKSNKVSFQVIDSKSKAKGEDDYQGIIGMDIIRKYFWFFDFHKDKVFFSKSEIKTNESIKVLEMPYELKFDVLYVSFVLNDSVKEKAVFDTGWIQAIISPSKEKMEKMDTIGWIDIQINGSFEKSKLFHYLKHRADEHPTVKGEKTLSMNRVVKINDYNVKNLLTYHADDNYVFPDSLDLLSNKFTVSFIKRFNGMAIDPLKKKISFYLTANSLPD